MQIDLQVCVSGHIPDQLAHPVTVRYDYDPDAKAVEIEAISLTGSLLVLLSEHVLQQIEHEILENLEES